MTALATNSPGDKAWPEPWLRWALLAVVGLFPVTAVLKRVYGLPFTWVNPSLLLGAGACLVATSRAPRAAWAACRRHAAFALPLVGFLLVYWATAGLAALGGQGGGWREPVRLALVVAVGLLPLLLAPEGRFDWERLLRLYAWLGVLELLLALALIATVAWQLPCPEAWRVFIQDRMNRQTVPLTSRVVVPRLTGSFYEGPAFGLFLFAAFVAADCLVRLRDHPRHRWLRALTLLGTVLSFSTQILAGLAVHQFLRHRLFDALRLRRLAPQQWLAMALCGALTLFVLSEVLRKDAQESKEMRRAASSGAARVYGRSLAERRYHAAALVKLWRQSPRTRWCGIGPGNYARQIVAEVGVFETQVTPQSLYVELLGETGLLGLGAFLLFAALSSLAAARRGDPVYPAAVAGLLLLGTAFQASWKVEHVAFLLAALYVQRAARDTRAASR